MMYIFTFNQAQLSRKVKTDIIGHSDTVTTLNGLAEKGIHHFKKCHPYTEYEKRDDTRLWIAYRDIHVSKMAHWSVWKGR